MEVSGEDWTDMPASPSASKAMTRWPAAKPARLTDHMGTPEERPGRSTTGVVRAVSSVLHS